MDARPPDPGAAAIWAPQVDDLAAGSERVRTRAPLRRFLARWLPGLVVAALLALLVGPTLGLIVVAVATLVALVATAVPAAGRGLDRFIVRVGTVIGRLLSDLLLGLVFIVLFVPVGLSRRIFRRDRLQLGHTDRGTTWAERRDWLARRLPDRSYGIERDLTASTKGRPVLASVGAVTLLLAVDLLVGSVALSPPVDDPGIGVAGGGPEAIPALAGEPYVPQLFTEIFSAGSGGYDPLLGWRLDDVRGEHLNIEDGARVSLDSALEVSDPVVIWFFGGSTMYGFGQRDEHTISSAVVRLAEQDGVAVEAHNFGTPAYNNWQGVQLFARLLTDRPPPDIAVFYDGYNDVSQQLIEGPHTEPTHALARRRQDAIERPEAVTDADDVRSWWADHSATANLVRRLRGRFDDADPPEVQLTSADSRVPDDISVDEVVEATEVLLGRGRALAGAVGDSFGVEVVSWWQPTLYTRDPDPGEADFFDQAENRTEAWFGVSERLAEGLPDDVLDLSDALDDVDGPIYWDTVHTNERGAAVIARAGYEQLRSVLER